MQILIKLKDAFLSVVPIFLIVMLLNFVGLSPLTSNEIIVFSIAAVLAILGMGFFTLGTDASLSKIGEYVGASITKRKSLVMIVILFFLLGVFITIAEPDISVLASQLPIDKWVFIIFVSLGVGIFMLIGVLRILFQKSLKVWLLGLYGLLFALACLVDGSFLPLSFDAGGVSTGPITVPFILALGIGVASSRAGEHRDSDSFGLTALCSMGPVIMVMILSLLMDKSNLTYTFENPNVGNDIFMQFLKGFGESAFDVALSLVPILVFFLIYQAIFIKLPRKTLIKIIVGLLYTYAGLVAFMAAVEVGFLPIGKQIGMSLGENEYAIWLLPLFGFALGLFTVLAEPAVPILVSQIQNVSDGAIKKRTVFFSLSIGVASAVCLSMIRIYYGFSIMYYLVPGYALALFLTFFVPDIYTAVAFDSGSVASGAMNASFIIPLATGACFVLSTIQGNDPSTSIMSNAFGVVAMVTLAPVITVQLVGLNATMQKKAALKVARNRVKEENDAQIIHFE